MGETETDLERNRQVQKVKVTESSPIRASGFPRFVIWNLISMFVGQPERWNWKLKESSFYFNHLPTPIAHYLANVDPLEPTTEHHKWLFIEACYKTHNVSIFGHTEDSIQIPSNCG